MKRFFKLLLLVLFLSFAFVLVSCNSDNNDDQNQPVDPVEPEDQDDPVDPVDPVEPDEPATPFDGITYESATYTYDGKYHSLEIKGLPEGAKVAYSSMKKQKDAGEYKYTATVTINGEKKSFDATLTITKADVILDISDQTLYLTDGYGICDLEYTINFKSAVINFSQSSFDEAGSYVVNYSFEGSDNFNAIASGSVNVTVCESHTGYYLPTETVTLESATDSYTIELIAKDANASIPEGYSVVYTNNVQSVQGSYQVLAKVVNDADQSVLEEFRSILTIDYPSNPEFNTFSEEMLVYFIGSDQATINLYFVHPENYGLEHSEAIWGNYEKYTQEQFESDLDSIKQVRTELNAFKDARLSYSQLLDYNIIDYQITFYENYITSTDVPLMKLSYVDQYGGYAADMPTTLEAYELRTKTDIDDALSYVNSTEESLASYMNYITDREEAGYTLSGFTLNGMAEYLEGVGKYYDSEEEYYLIRIYASKLDNCKESLGLTEEEVTNYKNQFATAFKEKFVKAHKDLALLIRNYMSENGKTEDEVYSYLYKYDGGTDLYVESLKDALGLKDTTVDELIDYLDEKFALYLKKFLYTSSKVSSNKSATKIVDGKTRVLESDDFDDIYAYLKEFSKTIVPELINNPEISVTYMDETVAKNTTALAYYMKSEVDSFDTEYIHLNGLQMEENANYYDNIMTLAHEGYPGHLYSYVYAKESDKLSPLAVIITCTGNAEGWAKYIEIALGYYIAEQKSSQDWLLAAEYNTYYTLFAYALEARIDLGVNYQGWTVSDCQNYLTSNGLNGSIAEDVFNTVNEVPAYMALYAYGPIKFYEWHETAKEVLGKYYDEIEFNTAILDYGWCSLDDLDIYLETYLSNKAFVCGCEYNK